MRSAGCIAFLLFTSLFSNAQLAWEVHSYNWNGTFLQRADMNGDGAPDLMLYGGNIEPIFARNNGDGTFNNSIFAQSDQVFDVQPGDFNRDGNIDFAGCLGNALEIIDGRGDGTFALPRHFPVACRTLAVADFNGDNKLDIAVVTSTQTGNTFNNAVIVYLGDGKGGFSSQVINRNVNFTSGIGDSCGFPGFNGMSVASDFNNDKKADLVLAMDCPTSSSTTGELIVGLGDGTGHFTFHKDQEFHFDANTVRLRIVDQNQDSKPDVIAVEREESDFGIDGFVIPFLSRGDGTFRLTFAFSSSKPISAGVVADFDGDGIKDSAAVVNDPADGTNTLQFRKGNADGSYSVGQTFDLPFPYTDMIWADFDRDGRVDLALVYFSHLDVWLNRTTSAPVCNADPSPRAIKLCLPTTSQSGDFHLIANSNDSQLVKFMQIYVDGTLKFETPDDLINTNLKLAPGQHRITVKGWDASGSFTNGKFVVVPSQCDNTDDRTVRICSPGAGTNSSPVRILANAATSKPFTVLQIYVDGVIKYRNGAKFADISLPMNAGPHHITVKGWDAFGAFSNAVDVTVP